MTQQKGKYMKDNIYRGDLSELLSQLLSQLNYIRGGPEKPHKF